MLENIPSSCEDFASRFIPSCQARRNRCMESYGNRLEKNGPNRAQQGVGRPRGWPTPFLGRLGSSLVGALLVGSLCGSWGDGLKLSWHVMWALNPCVTHDMIFCAFILCSLCVFMLFRTCVPAINNSPTLMEFVSNNSYSYYWCLFFKCLCRSCDIYFALNSCQQKGDL